MNAPSRKKRILLVDDEPFLTSLLRMNLEDTDEYEVREENNSLNALDVIKEFVPDLILLDVMMPDLDGADILFRLKNDQRLKHIVVVFHTATVSRTELTSHGGIISGYPFLPKPASADQIIAFIEANLPNPLAN
ncbi:MAG: response regulator [Verrucomicrobia bacterium]|jgi:CheY-like chemotaxis protein|nr:response regulator [Verrucomicrobiaceae bacterium]MCX6840138.1 response regulator [Verrucomicrobiota bacterium]MDH4451931.1 response regulator [Verrucomicrobiota bacterium]